LPERLPGATVGDCSAVGDGAAVGAGAGVACNPFESGFSGGGASLESAVSDPPENTSFSAPSIFMPPGLSGFTRIGRLSAVTTGISPL
jgi:hypothetical protein